MNVGNEEDVELLPASLGRALKKGLRDAYDRLGLVLASSFIWTTAMLVPLAAGAEAAKRLPTAAVWAEAAGVLAAIIVGAPMLAGIFRMAHKVVYRDDPSVADIFSGFRELARASLVLALVNAVVVGILAVDAAFFFGVFGPARKSGILFALGVLCLYILLGWFVAAIYQMPALAAQRPMGQRRGAIPAIKKSFVLAAANPGFTAGIFAVILAFSILCAISVIGVPVLYIGTVSILLTRALRELFVRYRIVEEPPEVAEDGGWNVE